MQTHPSLKNLYDSIYSLEFSVGHIMTRASEDDPSGVDVASTTRCNGLNLDEFTEKQQQIVESTLPVFQNFDKREILELTLQLDRITQQLIPDGKYTGHLKNIPAADLRKNEAFQMGALDYREMIDDTVPQQLFFKVIEDSIFRLSTELTNLLLDGDTPTSAIKKLKWKVKPAVLGALLHELDKRDWIDSPATNGEVSYPKLAKLATEVFEFEGTERALYNAISNKDSDLVFKKRDSIKLPRKDFFS